MRITNPAADTMRAKIDGSGTGETLMLSMLTELTSEPGVISTSKLLIGSERKGAKPIVWKPPGGPPKLGSDFEAVRPLRVYSSVVPSNPEMT